MATKLNKNADIQIVDFRYDVGLRGRVEYDIGLTITTMNHGISNVSLIAERERDEKMDQQDNLRIRKLTERECGRLMGFDDYYIDRMKEAGLSRASMMHCFGDSIVVAVLENIFKEML